MMMRPCRWLVLCLLLLGALPLLAIEVDVTPVPTTPEVPVEIENVTPKAPPSTGAVQVAIVTEQTGNLFTPGQPVQLVVTLTNPGAAERASLTTRVSSSLGCPVHTDMLGVKLPEKGTVTQAVAFDDARKLPNGPYRIDVVVEGDKAYGYGWTLFSVWDGPAKTLNDTVGIALTGVLDDDRVGAELDLFKSAGVGWLRFPLRGWLPQGTAVPRETAVYKRFIGEATERKFSLVAAFTPTTTVDPAINKEQAGKEYRESLMAAAANFGPQVPFWELLTVKPDPLYPELRGIRAPELLLGREALRGFNKNLVALFPIETPFTATTMDLAAVGLPPKGDLLGIHYDFIGLPETRDANPKAPLFELPGVMNTTQSLLKRMPPVWVTEYGFDATKGERLPAAAHQAALMARAVILNRVAGIPRTFWRHNAADQYELPLVTKGMAASPTFLAMRTVLEKMNGMRMVSELPAPSGMHAFVFATGDTSKKRRNKRVATRYMLVIWTERVPSAATLRIGAAHASITDLWGTSTEFEPVDNAILTTVDPFPRFVDMGTSDAVEVINPFAHFAPARVLLQPGGDNAFTFEMLNDPRVFSSAHVFDINFRRWPNTEEVKTFQAPFNYQYDRYSRTFPLIIPTNARKGQIFEVTAEIKVATRRVGMLTLPVWYTPEPR